MAELMRGRSEAQRLYIVITAAFLVVTILLCVIFLRQSHVRWNG